MSSKQELRKEALARRASLAAAVPDFAQLIARLYGDLDIPADSIVAFYWPIRDEADPRALAKALAARGHRLALPRIEGDVLSFRRWNEGDALVDNHHGIAEPRDAAEILIPTVILVPLLAFDATGHRLGYGGGYYDRALAALTACAIGVAYAGQEVAALPREPHDRRLDAAITENGVRKFTTRPE
ncbi:MAG TPA: 5-formyltetrahydrofolate cyclo-ligase [Rhizomicrobium sp.]|nr:5-formyltetrahydrofolate cyclo-ligase [Rhizomicrobium sp.]